MATRDSPRELRRRLLKLATAAQRKAAAKWVGPLLQALNDPAVWAIKADLAELKEENNLYLDLVNAEISTRINTPVKTVSTKKEEIYEW